MTSRVGSDQPDRHALVDALLATSRALMAIAARSLSDLDAEVTLPQFRALVVLASRGPRRAIDLAGELGVSPSTATRMCDRLVRKKLVRRTRPASNRREVRLTLTATGRQLVSDVTLRRRAELDRIVAALPEAPNADVIRVLRQVAAATGEPPEREWWLGWHDSDADEADDEAAG